MMLIARFLRNENGATAIEYGLIMVGIVLVIITTVRTVGTSLIPIFTNVATGLQ